MRLRSMKRDLCQLTAGLGKVKSQLLNTPRERIRHLAFAIKEVRKLSKFILFL